MVSGFELRGKKLVQKHQVFLSSTIFNPSRGLLDAGGVVDVYAIGAGGSGAINGSGGSGGDAGQTIHASVVVSGPTAVVIGAGGATVIGSTGNAGGNTSFGSVVALGGNGGSATASDLYYSGGAGSGGSAPVLGSIYTTLVLAPSGHTKSSYKAASSRAGGPPNIHGHGFGGRGDDATAGGDNTGNGGGGNAGGTSGAGGSGRVELTWWEYAQ